MAALTTLTPAITGTEVTWTAADVAGDTFSGSTRGVLLVRNDDASSKTVTVVIPGTTYGQANPDVAVVVASGDYAAIGPFDAGTRSGGTVSVTYSAVTSLFVAYVELD